MTIGPGLKSSHKCLDKIFFIFLSNIHLWISKRSLNSLSIKSIRRETYLRSFPTSAMVVQQVLSEDPFGGAVYAFRGRRGSLLKLLWHDGIGLCLLAKRLERGHFVWPMTSTGAVSLTPSQALSLRETPSLRRCWKAASGGRLFIAAGRSWQASRNPKGMRL